MVTHGPEHSGTVRPLVYAAVLRIGRLGAGMLESGRAWASIMASDPHESFTA